MEKLKSHIAMSIITIISVSLISCGPSEEEKRRVAIEKENEMIAATMSKLKQEAEQKVKEAENARLEALKSIVLNHLTDPESAQFRKLKLLSGDKGLCGELNAKNKFGGYVGFRAFAVGSNEKAVILKSMSLDIAKEDDSKMKELAVALKINGSRSEAESLIEDSVFKKDFAHWKECTN